MSEIEAALHETCTALGGRRMVYSLGYNFNIMEPTRLVFVKFVGEGVLVNFSHKGAKTYSNAEALLLLRALSPTEESLGG